MSLSPTLEGGLIPCEWGEYEGPGWTGWTTCIDRDRPDDKSCRPCQGVRVVLDLLTALDEFTYPDVVVDARSTYDLPVLGLEILAARAAIAKAKGEAEQPRTEVEVALEEIARLNAGETVEQQLARIEGERDPFDTLREDPFKGEQDG